MRSWKVLTMLLAGGVGERLFPLTSNRCKPAVPFGGNFRIIDFTLMNCLLSGLRQVYVLGQYHVQSLHSHQRSRWGFLAGEFGEFIEIVPPKLRAVNGHYQGTADAIYRNLDLIDRTRPDVVLILSGDHVYRADYRAFIDSHIERNADVSVLTGKATVRDATSFGVVDYDSEGRISSFVEKPGNAAPYAVDGHCRINLGVYCFKTEFLAQALVADAKRDTAHDFGKNILPESLSNGRVLSCPLDVISPDGTSYWRDVGTIDSYFETNMDLLKSPSPFQLADSRWPEGSRFFDWLPARSVVRTNIEGRWIHGRNLMASGTEVDDASVVNSIIAPRCVVERDAELENCILLPGARIGAGAKLRNAIVEEGVDIPSGALIGFGGDARRFVVSPKGVVVVGGGPVHLDDQPEEQRRVTAVSRLSHITDRMAAPAEPPEMTLSPTS